MHDLRWLAAPALLLGLVAGWALPHPEPELAPSPVLRGPVCGKVPERAVGTSAACDTERRDACWAELAERAAPAPTTRVGFEGVPEQEQPDAWLPQLEELVAGCDPDAAIEVTDCSTFPCVAAVRAGRDWMQTDCDLLLSDELSLVPLPLEVGCPDGSVEEILFVTMLAEGTAKAALGIPEDEEPNGLISGLVGQRVDTLLEMWPCAGS